MMRSMTRPYEWSELMGAAGRPPQPLVQRIRLRSRDATWISEPSAQRWKLENGWGAILLVRYSIPSWGTGTAEGASRRRQIEPADTLANGQGGYRTFSRNSFSIRLRKEAVHYAFLARSNE